MAKDFRLLQLESNFGDIWNKKFFCRNFISILETKSAVLSQVKETLLNYNFLNFTFSLLPSQSARIHKTLLIHFHQCNVGWIKASKISHLTPLMMLHCRWLQWIFILICLSKKPWLIIYSTEYSNKKSASVPHSTYKRSIQFFYLLLMIAGDLTRENEGQQTGTQQPGGGV